MTGRRPPKNLHLFKPEAIYGRGLLEVEVVDVLKDFDKRPRHPDDIYSRVDQVIGRRTEP